FAPLVKAPGTSTPDGRAVVGLVVETIRDDAIVFVDSIGVGASVYDMLRRDNFRAIPLNFAAHTYHTDRTGTMAMSNVRAAAYWGLREALDPESKLELALPPDPELKADLCAPRWKM